MTEENRKLLTEWLGECWHDYRVALEYLDGNAVAKEYVCEECSKVQDRENDQRTFATPSDLWDLTQRLAYKGFWRMYLHFAEDAYRKEIRSALTSVDSFVFWMADPARCQTIADFLKEGE